MKILILDSGMEQEIFYTGIHYVRYVVYVIAVRWINGF